MASLAEQVGIAAYAGAITLSLYDLQWAMVPLAMFVVLSLIAPFWVTVGFFLPIISRGTSGKKAIALTFDDGPDPATTPELLKLLAEHHVKATFFVTGSHTAAYPELIRRILEDGHTIGNHSYHHDPILMLRGYHTLKTEIESTQNLLKVFGVIPLSFRPPAGITNPKLHSVLNSLNMFTVNFSCRAMDKGNRQITNLSKRILQSVRPDDIILLHDIQPKEPSQTQRWVNEVHSILSGLRKMGFEILPLAELIGKPVMNQSIH